MVDERPYRNEQIRDRIETVNEKVIKMEGRQDGHEILCAQRYTEILKQFVEIRATISAMAKYAVYGFVILFFLELGKATFPTLFEVLAKAIH